VQSIFKHNIYKMTPGGCLGAEVAYFWAGLGMPLSAAGRSASIVCKDYGSNWVLKLLTFG
jgi:hypothetical protein